MVASHTNVEVWEEFLVLCEVIRDVIWLEEVVNSFVRSAFAFHNGDLLD